MPPTLTSSADSIVALQSLRRPIETFIPRHASDERFQASMVSFADQLEELWNEGEDETLDSDIVWTALYAFNALTLSGPTPEEWVGLATCDGPEGSKWSLAVDAETAATLRTLKKIRQTLRAYQPPGFAAGLWRAVLLAIYGMIELFVLVDDERNTDRCFELLDAAEAMADRFAGKA